MPTRTQQADLLSCAYASHGDTKHVLLLPEDPTEASSSRAQAFDLADRLQTPIFVMLDLDIGMQDWLTRAVRVGRRAPHGSRQGDDRRPISRRASDFGRYLDVDGDGIPYRTYPGTHADEGQLLHARHDQGPLRALHARKAPPTSTTCSACCASSRRRRSSCRSPSSTRPSKPTQERRDLLRLDRRGDGRVARRARARRHPPRPAARARVPVRRRGRRLHRRARPRVRRRAEPRRADEVAARQRMRHRSRRASSRCCTTTARRSPRASSRARSPRRRGSFNVDAASPLRSCLSPHDLSRQAQAPSPVAAAQRARLHASRLRRRDLDAVRGLRPRLDLGGDHPGVLRAGRAAAPRGQAVGHRLLVEDADVLPRQLARLQQRARPHAFGADRRSARQSRPHLPRRVGRRRFGVDRPRPVRARHAPRREHGVHRREQRRVRPHQGPVLGDRRQGQQEQARRGQQRRADRPRGARADARRDVRRARLLRRQGRSSCR